MEYEDLNRFNGREESWQQIAAAMEFTSCDEASQEWVLFLGRQEKPLSEKPITKRTPDSGPLRR